MSVPGRPWRVLNQSESKVGVGRLGSRSSRFSSPPPNLFSSHSKSADESYFRPGPLARTMTASGRDSAMRLPSRAKWSEFCPRQTGLGCHASAWIPAPTNPLADAQNQLFAGGTRSDVRCPHCACCREQLSLSLAGRLLELCSPINISETRWCIFGAPTTSQTATSDGA